MKQNFYKGYKKKKKKKKCEEDTKIVPKRYRSKNFKYIRSCKTVYKTPVLYLNRYSTT